MKRLLTISIALMVTLIFSGMAFGQAAEPRSQGMPGETSGMKSEAMTTPRASEIIGKDVQGQGGEKLGEVEDLVLSKEGNIDYLIISQGGTLGVGDKLTAVPWHAAKANFEGDQLVIGLSKDKLDSAPKFSDWDEFKQGNYEQQVRSYYGEGAGGKSPGAMEKSPGSESGTKRY